MKDRFLIWVPDFHIPEVFGRSLARGPTVTAWVVMLLGIIWGWDSYERNFRPDWAALEWSTGGNHGANFHTYYYAAELAQEGQVFYEVPPPGLDEWAVFLYPPITVLAYYPFTLLEWMTGYWIIVGLNILAGIGAAVMIVRIIERDRRALGWVDVVLIAGLFVLSPFSFGTIYYGNINILLALGFILGFVAVEDGRETIAGISFGLAALWKVFPALVGVWLLWRRSWRAIAAAIGIGGGGLVAGLVVFGWEPTYRFFTDVLMGRTDTARFVGGYPADGLYYVTLQRPVSHLIWFFWAGAPAEVLLPATLFLATGLLVPFYYRLDDQFDVLIAIFATVVVTITVIPALQWYIVLLFFPMLPLLYLWNGPGRMPFFLGAVLLFINERPGDIVDWIDGLNMPSYVTLLLTWVFSIATVQLYAIVLMLAACAYWKYADSVVSWWRMIDE